MNALLSNIRFRDADTLLGLFLISVVFASQSESLLTTSNLMIIF